MPVFNIAYAPFRNIFGSKKFDLPRRWDGKDFKKTLDALFEEYKKAVRATPGIPSKAVEQVEVICSELSRTVEYYFEDSPSAAYTTFRKYVMCDAQSLMRVDCGDLEVPLFRLASVGDNAVYDRKRVFHTPYSLRAKVSTSRYSIAGHPSLYLGTSLPLCWEELHLAPQDFAIAAAYKLSDSVLESVLSKSEVAILDLGLKPQDFLGENAAQDRPDERRYISFSTLSSSTVRGQYLVWYPLVAACSFIRVSKKDPFAAEYVIPQLLTQWVRNQVRAKKSWEQGANNENFNPPRIAADLIGIRYFSCASKRAAGMGFDYVFPTSGEGSTKNPDYCAVLSNVFVMTEPAYLLDYPDVEACENYLRSLLPTAYKDPLS